MPIIHKFVSAQSDGADSSLVRPSNWNDSHVVTLAIVNVSANYTQTATDEVLLVTAGTSGVNISLLDASTVPNTLLYVKMVDAGPGAVVISPTGSQTIDGATTYRLVNQNQFVKILSDGGNWYVVGCN